MFRCEGCGRDDARYPGMWVCDDCYIREMVALGHDISVPLAHVAENHARREQETALTEGGKTVAVVPCNPCKGTGTVVITGGREATCCICGGKGRIIKGGFFDTENDWTVRTEVLA
jgi:hypothetical protein